MIKHCGKIAKEENEDMGKGMGFKKNKTQCQI